MTAVSDEVFVDYRRFCEEQWGITIVEKNESKLMKVLAVVLFFNKGFMTNYVTTIGKKVHWPNADKLTGKDFTTLFHEVQHAVDFTKGPAWFILSYLLPQILALFVLMSFLALTGNLFWLLALPWVLMLAPLPSITRAHWELRGYSCEMAYVLWTRGYVPSHMLRRIKKEFTSSAYYFMWPFSRSMDRKLEKAEKSILNCELTEVQEETARFLVHHGVVEESV